MMKNIKKFGRDNNGNIDKTYGYTSKIFTDDNFTCLNDDCQEFVKGLLNVDYRSSAKDGGRFSAEEAMEHTWIKNVGTTLVKELRSDNCARESLEQL